MALSLNMAEVTYDPTLATEVSNFRVLCPCHSQLTDIGKAHQRQIVVVIYVQSLSRPQFLEHCLLVILIWQSC